MPGLPLASTTARTAEAWFWLAFRTLITAPMSLGTELMSKRKKARNSATARANAIAILEDLYSQLPALECKGRCHDSCTSIDASELERERLRERGIELPIRLSHQQLAVLIAADRTPRCPALSALNTCAAYDVRPFICRAFGMVYDPATGGGLMCDHGCIPDKTMTPAELFRLLREIELLSVEVTGVSRRPTDLAPVVRRNRGL